MKKVLFIAFALLFSVTAVSAQNYKYIGASKCKMCHNKPATGKQFEKWSNAPHAGAYATLNSEESWAYAKEHGIADPTKEASCLECHSTYHAADAKLRATITETEGVSCETCHGAGSAYKAASVMRDKEYAMERGLIEPTEAVCKTCHNEKSPHYKGFNFAEAMKVIAHPNPAAK